MPIWNKVEKASWDGTSVCRAETLSEDSRNIPDPDKCAGSPTLDHGISRRQGRDIPWGSLGIPLGSHGILACKSFRNRDRVKKRLFIVSHFEIQHEA